DAVALVDRHGRQLADHVSTRRPPVPRRRRRRRAVRIRAAGGQMISRRAFLAGMSAFASTWRPASAGPSGIDPSVLAKRVEKLYKIGGCKEPNDLQFVPEGLWVLDQVDPNKAFLVRPEDGSIIRAIQTESIHGSGITYGNGALWIGSTKMTDPAV